MHRCIDRANGFARRIFAVLADHRFHDHFRILFQMRIVLVPLRAGEVSVDADPVHFPASIYLIFTDDRDVVFRLAGDHASRATNASIQVDNHTPLVWSVEGRMAVQRYVRRNIRIHPDGFRKARISLEFFDGGFSDQGPTFHAVVVLRLDEPISILLNETYRGSRREIWRVGGPQRVGVETCPLPHLSDYPTSIPERQTKRIVSMAGGDHHGRLQLFTIDTDLDKVAVIQLEGFRSRFAQRNRVIPRDLCYGIRQFLQPAVIGVPAVIDLVIGRKYDFDRTRGYR